MNKNNEDERDMLKDILGIDIDEMFHGPSMCLYCGKTAKEGIKIDDKLFCNLECVYKYLKNNTK